MSTKHHKCKYNDCGWCYAPKDKKTNAEQGQCKCPLLCEEREIQVIAKG